MGEEESQNGYEQELAAYEEGLAEYLQARIKPGLTSSAIPLMARSIAKEITRREPPEPLEAPEVPEAPEGGSSDNEDEQPDFETDMRELQGELGDDWILRFSVHGERGWLTAEKEDGSQRVEAPTATRLIAIVDAIQEEEG